ncbi:MAG: protein kinase [Gemmatimonas sp.]
MTHQTDRLSTALAGRYRIERALGAGGMATVYLAEDLKHDRKVAIKVLKPELAAVLGAERFVVEIKTTAAMSHPHILPLFDSGTADGFLFYVMPYIAGETIREKLNRETQFGVDDAVRIAREVADALDYAHRHGVIHRDIKPENIMLHDGRAMVMDFGIALAVSAAAGGRMTETGLSLGTPHYMSPEQATAEKEITPRSDEYSLASVLYEMLAGQPPHVGGAAQQVIMRIITEQARPVNEFRKNVPAHVVAALAKALEKLPADRFESVKTFSDALTNQSFATAAPTSRFRAGQTTGVSQRVFLATAAIAVVAIVAAAWALSRREPKPVTRVSIALPDNHQLTDGTTQWRVALSPDGRTIVYAGGPPNARAQLWVRKLDDLSATPLAGTEGASNPSFSPDGKHIAYLGNVSARVIRVIPVAGGPSVTVADSLVDNGGVSWGHDGYIYFDAKLAGDGLARVRETGGKAEVASMTDTAARESFHVHPAALPNGRGVLFSVAHGMALDGFDVAVLDTRTGKHRILVHATSARYAPSGHLLYMTATGAMFAVPFDINELRITGEAVPIFEGVAVRSLGRAEVEVAANGTLLYAAGGSGAVNELVWVARDGSAVVVDSSFTGRFVSLKLSPDARSAVLTRVEGTKQSVVVKQLDRGPTTKVADDGTSPTWSADGKSILFVSRRGIERVPADGSRLPALVSSAQLVASISVSGDGKWLFYGQAGVYYGLMFGDTVPRRLTEGLMNRRATLSPDGKWLAYDYDGTGRFEVIVVPFPDVFVARHQVTTSTGGNVPRWSPDGKALYFMDDQSRELWSAPVTLGAKFSAGTPRREFRLPGIASAAEPAPDGRFLALRLADERARSGGIELILVENFLEELKGKAKVK